MANIEDIIIKVLRKEQSAEEQEILDQWIAASEKNKVLFEQLTDQQILEEKLIAFHKIELGKEEARKGLIISKVRSIFSWTKVAAAAVIILLLSVGGYFYFNNKTLRPAQGDKVLAIKNDIAPPASGKATITLANGKQIELDSAGIGTLAKQGDVNITKLADGQIAYSGPSTGSGEIQYNTLNNPKGSKVMDMTLADGSRVWLNAGSSVTYPVAFVGNERKVKITGEAYFEVTHNASMPFVVDKNDVSVQVLGTHFNVNSYDDEAAIKVTLLQGSVKVKIPSKTNLLKPGQQAVISNGELSTNNSVDVDEVIAWKNGKFQFGEKADIQTIMRQIARWYNVDVAYNGNVNQNFGGSISRNVNLSQVLKMLEITGGVKFKVEGNKVTVMP